MAEIPPINFIGNIGHFQNPPPYKFNGITIREFELKASFEALERLCDKYLNLERPEQWTPATPCVQMMVVSYDKMSGAHTGQGYTKQDELAFQLLVDGPGTLAWYSPFLVVNNPLSLINGREVSGFPKAWGDFRIPREAPWMPIEVDTWAFAPNDPNSEFKPRTLLTIEECGECKTPSVERIATWPFRQKITDFNKRAKLAPTIKDMKGLAGAPDGFEIYVDAIQMREFSDFVTPGHAAYQAINRAKYLMIDDMDGAQPLCGALPEPKITLNTFPGLNLIETLGLEVHNCGPLQGSLVVEDARWCRLDEMQFIDPAVAYTA